MEDEIFESTGQYLPNGRPIYKNQFGDFVTERTITEYIPELNGWFNIPTFYNGQLLEPRKAIQMVIETGGKDPVTQMPLDRFDDVKSAVSVAEKRSSNLGGLLSERFSIGRGNNAPR